MKIYILMGSPRLHGNTAELLKPFIDELEKQGAAVTYATLADKEILPCSACYACQKTVSEYGCPKQDDMQEIAAQIIQTDCLVLATPIYTWYCTAEMKAVLDRHFGFNKFYGKTKGSLWAGKKCAIIATHGYDREYAVQPFEMGVQRLCEHSKLQYRGIYSVRDKAGAASFQSEEAAEGARAFARSLLTEC